MDCRDYQRMFGLPYREDNHKMMIYIYDEDGPESPEEIAAFEKACYEDNELGMPAKRIVCPLCNGKGSHVNPSIDSHGLTREDFDDDPDFAENYFSGMYDVPCYRCNGRNVCLVVDEEKCDKHLLAYFRRVEEDERQYNAMCASELRMGC